MQKTNNYIGIFLISLATLLLELSLTRVMSVSLWYHFGFLVISTALLGFGTAGVVLASWKNLREHYNLSKSLTWLSILFGIVTVLSFYVLQKIPFNPFSIATDSRQLYIMPLYYLTISAPFFISGLIISLLFTRISKDMSKLYAVDLIGAAIGCLIIVWTMPNFGGNGSVIMAAAIGSLAVLAFSEQLNLKLVGLILSIMCIAIAIKADEVIPISISENKRNPERKYEPIYKEWNTFSFIEIYEREANPKTGFPGARRFVIDGGTAATGMWNMSYGLEAALNKYPGDSLYESNVAYLHISNPSILNIGSGGGQEVLDGLHKNARKITCVEINPIINKTVKHTMNEYWGGLFNHPNVELITEEGRNFINRSDEKFDVVVSSHTISNAAVASGALGLSENFILTKEAFDEYLEHLTPDGTIYFTRPESHMARLFTTGREALADIGITDFTKHFYSFTIPTVDKNASSFVGYFVMKKSSFTPQEIENMDNFRLNLHTKIDGKLVPYKLLYSPYNDGISNIYDDILTTSDLKTLYSTTEKQIAPATDNKPFFNQHVSWSNIGWHSFKDVFSQNDPRNARMALENKPIAEVTLLTILIQSIVLAALLILIPLYRFSKAGLKFPNKWRYLFFFAALGLGFIMIEIAFIQRFTLYLGQPVFTLAVIIAGLLLSTGVGSYLSGKRNINNIQLRKTYIPVLLGVLLLTSVLTPLLFKLTIHLPLFARILLTLVLLAPMGILLGIPFPTGIKTVSKESDNFIPWAWGVNGFFTVIGSVGAVILGMMLGFNIVILLAILCYACAMFLIPQN
ncbi:MAG TPA: hypothetical protein VIS27_14460 [Yeosuana sp.]